MSHTWADQAIFYHIYPLGLCDAPKRNDFNLPPQPRLEKLYPWLDEMEYLGANALYLGPLFESTTHGYNTADYYNVDRRLGTRQTLADFSCEMHRRGMRLVLDGVFNHVGRDFWAFRDLLENRQASPYANWFAGVDFSRSSPSGDPFSYEGWAGHYSLVKLNLSNPDVRNHLFGAVDMWIEELGIDGLRLDAADVIDVDFLRALATHCKQRRPDFWLMGEIVHGDYHRLAGSERLDAVTNYEMYKSLYSSHADHNYFEVAYALNRQSGPDGIYRDIGLYNFADNHDVNRVYNNLKVRQQLYPLYCLLFSIPGTPSIYYGSEWGAAGTRTPHNDEFLRPALNIHQAHTLPLPELAGYIARLSRLRKQHPALQTGDYSQLHVASEQFAFIRSHPEEDIVVAVNSSGVPASIDLHLPIREGWLVDLLNGSERFRIANFQVKLNPLLPYSGRICMIERE